MLFFAFRPSFTIDLLLSPFLSLTNSKRFDSVSIWIPLSLLVGFYPVFVQCGLLYPDGLWAEKPWHVHVHAPSTCQTLRGIGVLSLLGHAVRI